MTAPAAVAGPPVNRTEQVTGRRTTAKRSVDGAIVSALVLLVLFVHPLGAILRRPFWLDEAWVANLARAPLWRQVQLSSSSPVGWTLLLRLVPGHAAQRFRVVPLIFSCAAAVLTYFLVRGLNWRNTIEARCASFIAGAAVVLAPISLARNDLKQYTSDAAFALLIVLLGRNAERDPRRRSLVVLSIVSVAVVPFSTSAAFVTTAVFAGLLGSAALQKRRRRVREVLICGVASTSGIAAYIAVVVLPHDNEKLRQYWRAFYLTGTPTHVLSTAWHRFANLKSSLDGPSIAVLFLFGVGLVVLYKARHVALAIAVLVLWLEMFALGVAERYPFLDSRTSHFLLIVTIVTASIGFAALALSRVRDHPLVMIVITVAVAGWLMVGARHNIRQLGIRPEDTRTQARYVAAHQEADDVIVVNLPGSYGFTYYWPGRDPKTYHATPLIAAGFFARVDHINAVFATDRTDVGVLRAMHAAISNWQRLGGGGRIWIALSHVEARERRAWSAAFRALNLQPVAVTASVEPLLVISPRHALT